MSEYMNEKFDYIINKTDEMIDELIDYFIKDKALLKEYLIKQSKEKEQLEQQNKELRELLDDVIGVLVAMSKVMIQNG